VRWAAVTALAALAWWRLGVSPVLAFWFTYVMTRSLGAAIALWLATRRSAGVLGLGQWPVSLSVAIIVLGLIAHMALSRHDTPDATVPNSGAAAYARVPVQQSPVVSHRRISSPRRADDSPNRRAGARA
jgi:hypothetical protein